MRTYYGSLPRNLERLWVSILPDVEQKKVPGPSDRRSVYFKKCFQVILLPLSTNHSRRIYNHITSSECEHTATCVQHHCTRKHARLQHLRTPTHAHEHNRPLTHHTPNETMPTETRIEGPQPNQLAFMAEQPINISPVRRRRPLIDGPGADRQRRRIVRKVRRDREGSVRTTKKGTDAGCADARTHHRITMFSVHRTACEGRPRCRRGEAGAESASGGLCGMPRFTLRTTRPIFLGVVPVLLGRVVHSGDETGGISQGRFLFWPAMRRWGVGTRHGPVQPPICGGARNVFREHGREDAGVRTTQCQKEKSPK